MPSSADATLGRGWIQLAIAYTACVSQRSVATAAEDHPLSQPGIIPFRESMTQQLQRLDAATAMVAAPIRSAARWDTFALLASCALLSAAIWHYRRLSSSEPKRKHLSSASEKDREPSLLKDNSSLQEYRTPRASYPFIRTFFHPHAQADQLPKEPKPLPVLVFVHGLGGSLAQFHPLLTSLVNIAPCFGVDLPGCGRSEFAPQDWRSYSHDALVELLDVVLGEACERAQTEEAVLICHSMGCSLAASLLAANRSRLQSASKVTGMIAICPKASQLSTREIATFRRVLSMPSALFNFFRAWDRRGGVQSASVLRFVGDSASLETRKLQLRFNEQSKTGVWRRMAWGALPSVLSNGKLDGGLPSADIWAAIHVPLFLVAGESDRVTKPEEINIIKKAVCRSEPTRLGTPIPQADGTLPRSAALKTSILPAPAGHGLLYDHATYRTLSGLILTFLADHIEPRLSMSWQLQHLKETNKWDVKNLAKWKGVTPVSGSIAGTFHALKTLRDGDEYHSPTAFIAVWGTKIKAVIDISHDTIVYNPHDLEKGGIEYHKFPTASKIPPTVEEVKDFIALVDQLRLEEKASSRDRLIGVHCHYGFNRTGFLICSYLIERQGYSVQTAVDEFAAQKPPGIRHEHFLDTLFVRYCIGLKRAPTM